MCIVVIGLLDVNESDIIRELILDSEISIEDMNCNKIESYWCKELGDMAVIIEKLQTNDIVISHKYVTYENDLISERFIDFLEEILNYDHQIKIIGENRLTTNDFYEKYKGGKQNE